MTRKLGQPFNRMLEDRDREYESLERRLEQKAEQERLEQQKEQERLRQKAEQERLERERQSIIDNDDEIISGPGYWRIKYVPYRNSLYTVDLAKSLLGLGNAQRKRQFDWISYRIMSEPNDFYTGSLPLHHAVFRRLNSKRNHPEAINAIKFIQRELEHNWLATLTQIHYKENTGWRSDTIVHNVGTSNEYEIERPTQGANIFISDSAGQIPWEAKESIKSILDTRQIENINAVYQRFEASEIQVLRRAQSRQEEIKNATLMKVGEQITFNLISSREDQLVSLGMRLLEKEAPYDEEPQIPF